MKPFTVFIRQGNNQGTTWVGGGNYKDAEQAKTECKADCSADWGGWDIDDLHILGVATGDVHIIEWEDLDE